MKKNNSHCSSVISLYRQAEDYFFREIAFQTKDFADEATAYRTGAPVGDLNPVFVRKHALSFEEILKVSESFYGSLPFTMVIPENLSDHHTILKNRNYAQTIVSHCMMLDLDAFHEESIIENEVKILPADQHLSEWMIPLSGGFECPLETVFFYAKAHEEALKKKVNLCHFTLYQKEEPVTSVTLSVNHNLARLDDLATGPKHQRKGYGKHLLIYALQEAKKKGARYCCLESSDEGLALYEKRGFKTLFKNQIYTPPERL